MTSTSKQFTYRRTEEQLDAELRHAIDGALGPHLEPSDDFDERALRAAVGEAAERLWEALATLGMVDSFGGSECRRVLPLALIRHEANASRETFDTDAFYGRWWDSDEMRWDFTCRGFVHPHVVPLPEAEHEEATA